MAQRPLPNVALMRTNEQKKRVGTKKTELTKKFVLDTNVLMHDPMCLYRFDEHDVYIPMVTLEELDDHKKGMSEVARNARQTSRLLDDILTRDGGDMEHGYPLSCKQFGEGKGRLFFQSDEALSDHTKGMSEKADNVILSVVAHLKKIEKQREIILVSKDINMRIKARARGIEAQDYQSDKVIEDADLLYTGIRELNDDFWNNDTESVDAFVKEGHTKYRVKGSRVTSFHVNEFVRFHMDRKEHGARVVYRDGDDMTLEIVRDFTKENHNVWGIVARNDEQNFALNLLMNPEIDFVTLLGPAGTGKTLLTLAAALQQTIEHELYYEIIMTRVTVPVGEDIGFLPGTEEEKMNPWMGALEDNLDVLSPPPIESVHKDNGSYKPSSYSKDIARVATREQIRSRLKIKSLNFMRGRTFIRKFLIIDEAQNLTPKQMKTLITRAGPGTKVVCLGNLSQIDTPYLTEGSSGLAYVVDRFKGWHHGGHIILMKGERSRLADHANEVL